MPDDVAPENWALTVENAVCLFDVSPPWLNRALSSERRRLVRAVDGVSFKESLSKQIRMGSAQTRQGPSHWTLSI